MAATINTGPFVSAGSMLSLTGTPNSLDYNPVAGPGMSFQGDGLPDIRYWLQKDQTHRLGVIPAHFNSPYFLLCDTTPAASAATPVNIAAASTVVSGVSMTLTATGTTGVTPGIVLQPASSTGIGPQLPSTTPVSVVGLDFGFAMGNCTASTGTIATTVRSNTTANAVALFTPGQWLAIGRVGNSSGTTTLFTQVQSVGATGIVVSPAPQATVAAAPIGSANLYDINLQVMQPSLLPTTVQPYLAGGIGLWLNPLETCARCVGIAGSSGAPSGVFTVRGFTVYGEPLTEAITHTGSTGVAFGKKAFKYIQSVSMNQTTTVATFSVGTGDTFGFAVRSDFWEYTNLFWNGAFLSAQTGWLAADLTTPATTTTGDSRGTLQVSTRGAGSGVPSGATANGAIRLAIFASIPLYNILAGVPSNTAPMYGVTPV